MRLEGIVRKECPRCGHRVTVKVYKDTTKGWGDAEVKAENFLDRHMLNYHGQVSPSTVARMVEKFLEENNTGWTWEEFCSGVEVGEVRP